MGSHSLGALRGAVGPVAAHGGVGFRRDHAYVEGVYGPEGHPCQVTIRHVLRTLGSLGLPTRQDWGRDRTLPPRGPTHKRDFDGTLCAIFGSVADRLANACLGRRTRPLALQRAASACCVTMSASKLAIARSDFSDQLQVGSQLFSSSTRSSRRTTACAVRVRKITGRASG